MFTLIDLQRRRKELGMSYSALARRSGVSAPTVVRMFRIGVEHATFANVIAVARALGMTVNISEDVPSFEMRQREARSHARRLVGMVQATSGLEAQGVDGAFCDEMIDQTTHELMAKPKSRLWVVDSRK